MACERKKLTAEIIKDIGIIHRFDPPHKYEIGNTGVTIDLRYQAWPSAMVDENGVIYAFISGRQKHIDPFGQTLLYKSYDNGDTWSDPIIVNDTPMDDRDVGVAYLGNGKILITYFRISAWGLIGKDQSFVNVEGREIRGSRPDTKNDQGYHTDGYASWQNPAFSSPEQVQAVFDYWKTMTYEELDGGTWCLTSEDYGETWSKPMPTPCSTPHGPIVRKDGSLLYVGRGRVAGVGGDGIYAFTSNDFGRSWQFVSKIHENTCLTYCEPHVVELDSGRLVVAMRVQIQDQVIDGKLYQVIGFDPTGVALWVNKDDGRKYYHITESRVPVETEDRAPHTGYRLYTCFSDDNGQTWSQPMVVTATNPEGLESVSGQPYGTPPHLLKLDGGEIVMTYATRNFDIGERAIVSYDDGKTWDKEIILCNKPYDTEPGSPYNYKHGDIGYPATVKTADGNLVSVYYQAYTDDRYCSYLYTKWSLK